MAGRLTPRTIEIVKASIPALEAHGVEITNRMYVRMFENEMIRAMFNSAHQAADSQPKAVAQAVLAYARNIETLDAMAGAVERIAQKHVALDIRPEHYPYVGEALLGAIGDVLGDAATDEVLAAWSDAYDALADILIGREREIYVAAEAAPGGWRGWRRFEISEIREESAIIRSFILTPADGGPVRRHLPGQYLGLRLTIDGVGDVRRNYSISCAPNDRFYRITVKREPGTPAGLVSNWLHDMAMPGTVVDIAPPAGDFVLHSEDGRPTVLLSGGVGLTPMVSMLETIAAEHPDRPTWFVHAARNGKVHAMRDHVRDVAARARAQLAVFYDQPGENDRKGEDYDHAGLVTPDWLKANTPVDDGVFYLCGPKPFMQAMVRGLSACGVDPRRIRYEFFGPADEDLLAA